MTSATESQSLPESVLPVSALSAGALSQLLEPLGLRWQPVADGAEIPGSYWGDSEAGLIGNVLHLRSDTPVHSTLHEACHWLLADAERRAVLHTDAGGSDTEENAVCYLQCLLADQLAGYSRARCFADMDACWSVAFAPRFGGRGREVIASSSFPFNGLSLIGDAAKRSTATSSLDTVMRSVPASTI